MTEQTDVVVSVKPFFLSKPATCRALGDISMDRLEKLMRAGEIVPKTIGGRVVFPVEEVERYASEVPSWEPKRSAS